MSRDFMKRNIIGMVALVVAVFSVIYCFNFGKYQKRIAFVDTQRLLVGFKEAHKVNKEIQAEDEKMKSELKVIEDSLKVFMDSMTTQYDRSDLKRREELREALAIRNQQRNNFERINTKRIQEKSQEKLTKVYEKINAFMKEYGKAKRYEMILGTANGSILYGEGTSFDITNDVVLELNKRYE